MTDKEILTEAIDKAVLNGYDQFNTFTAMNSLIKLEGRLGIEHNTLRGIIFSHSFAKAFWGEEEIETREVQEHKCDGYISSPSDIVYVSLPTWQYYLQNMVLCENPIAYLEEFL